MDLKAIQNYYNSRFCKQNNLLKLCLHIKRNTFPYGILVLGYDNHIMKEKDLREFTAERSNGWYHRKEQGFPFDLGLTS